jgi:hypothetical protein
LPPAISLSEQPCLQICLAAQWVRVPHRDPFWHAVLRELERPPSGDVARTITAAFLTYWQPDTPVP